MGEFLPIIVFIGYLVFNIYKAVQSSKEKAKSNPSVPSSPTQKSKPKPSKKPGTFSDLWDELKEILDESKSSTPPKPSTSKTTTPRRKPISVAPKETTSPREKQVQPVSMEITEAPYSNLEMDILDKVHKRKLHQAQLNNDQLEVEDIDQSSDLLEGLDLQKAFVHSLIFERKYFKN